MARFFAEAMLAKAGTSKIPEGYIELGILFAKHPIVNQQYVFFSPTSFRAFEGTPRRCTITPIARGPISKNWISVNAVVQFSEFVEPNQVTPSKQGSSRPSLATQEESFTMASAQNHDSKRPSMRTLMRW
jgi:hypothetical protein